MKISFFIKLFKFLLISLLLDVAYIIVEALEYIFISCLRTELTFFESFKYHIDFWIRDYLSEIRDINIISLIMIIFFGKWVFKKDFYYRVVVFNSGIKLLALIVFFLYSLKTSYIHYIWTWRYLLLDSYIVNNLLLILFYALLTFYFLNLTLRKTSNSIIDI